MPLVRMWILLLTTSLLGCGARPSKPVPLPPVHQVQYLPSPVVCLRLQPPQSPRPPTCLVPHKNDCSSEQLNEYISALLDHRERLITWSSLAWLACGATK